MNFGAPLQVRQALRMLGFSENEIRILLVLFKDKNATTMDLSKKTAISFSTTQYLVKNLVSRKIIRAVGKKEDTFEALTENEFAEWINEHKKINESLYEGAKNDLTNYLSNIKDESWRPQVLYYEDVEGIKEIYEDILNTGEDIYTWTDIDRIYKTLGDYMYEFIERRAKEGITTYAIMPKNRINLKHAGKKNENRKSKCIKNLPIDGEIRIYDNKVAVITYHGKKPVGIVLQGHIITKMFRTIFENAWKREEEE